MSGLSKLHAIVDVTAAEERGWAPAALARMFLDGGARCLQIRGKTLSPDRFLALCDEVVGLARERDAIVIVNDRVDLALMSGAAGVHVGQDDLSPSAARALVGEGRIVGYSTHSVDQIDEAVRDGVTSYIAVGPVFGTRTKDTGYEAVGVQLVAEAVRRSRGIPVVAIGGITLETAASVWAAGASSVAVISDLLAGDDPAARVASYNRLASAGPGLGG